MRKRRLLIALSAFFVGCNAPTSTRFVVDRGSVVRPTVAVAATSGDAYWSWIRRDDDGWNVYASAVRTDTPVPQGPIRVNHIPGNASPHDEAPAQVAVGPEGNVYIVWANRIDVEGRRFPASNLLVSVSTDGARTFSRERAINSDAEGPVSSHTFHNVVVLDDGTVVVSWIDSRARDNRTRGSTITSAATVTDHEALHGVGMHSGADDLPGSQIWVARSTDQGRTFVETAVVDDGSCPCCRTALAPGGGGVVYLAWRHVFDNGDRDVVVARSDDDGLTFSKPVRVSNDGWNIDACPHAGPAIAVDREGRVHIAWYTGVEDGPGLYRAVSTDRAMTFGARIPLATGVPMAYAALTAGRGDRIKFLYHVPSDETLVSGSIDGARLTGVATEQGGRPSLASAPGVLAEATALDSAVVGEIIRF